MKKAAIYILGAASALTLLAACGEGSGTITTPAPTPTVAVITPTPEAETEKPSAVLPVETEDLTPSSVPSADVTPKSKK